MGKTQWMISELVSAIKDGQPHAVVVGRNFNHVHSDLFPRVFAALNEAGLNPRAIRRDTIIADESRIDFQVAEQMQRYRLGRRGVGEFWDHFADEAASPNDFDEFIARNPDLRTGSDAAK